jgi:hypothetical protein
VLSACLHSFWLNIKKRKDDEDEEKVFQKTTNDKNSQEKKMIIDRIFKSGNCGSIDEFIVVNWERERIFAFLYTSISFDYCWISLISCCTSIIRSRSMFNSTDDRSEEKCACTLKAATYSIDFSIRNTIKTSNDDSCWLFDLFIIVFIDNVFDMFIQCWTSIGKATHAGCSLSLIGFEHRHERSERIIQGEMSLIYLRISLS